MFVKRLICALVTLVAFAGAGVWLVMGIDGCVVTSTIDTLSVSNPLNKTVAVESGAWLTNFNTYPILWALPALGVALPLITMLFSKADKNGWAFVSSSLTIACIILTCGVAMFPFIMPSSIMPNASLTMWDATSSLFTLQVMTVVAIIFVPIVLAYTAWCYYKCSVVWTKTSSKATSTRCIKEHNYVVFRLDPRHAVSL